MRFRRRSFRRGRSFRSYSSRRRPVRRRSRRGGLRASPGRIGYRL